MKRLLKLFAVVLAGILAVAFSGGQEKFGTELVDLMVIQGIGIDMTADGYRVSIQAINNTQNSFINGQGSPENMSENYVSSGASVAEALEHAVKLSGKKPLYAHNRVLIIGEEAAKKNIAGLLDFFLRDYNTKPTVLLTIARETTAESVINAKIGADALVSQLVENILKEGQKYGETNKMRVFEAVNYIKDKSSALCIPAISLGGEETTQGKGNTSASEKTVFLNGIAIFGENNELLGYLNKNEALGTLILNDEPEEGIFQVDAESVGTVVLKIEGIRTRTKVSYEGGRVYVEEKVTLHCDMIEIETKNFERLEKDAVDKIEEAAGNGIRKIAEEAVAAAQKTYKTDFFRYGRRLYLFENDAYKEIGDKWNEKFCEAQITISAEVVLRRTGEESLF